VKHLEWSRLLPGRFCIAPVALKYGNYQSYFVNASINGYKVILDNGIFEDNQVQDEDYIDLARIIKPRVLIVPDIINTGAKENLDAANMFAELVKVEELNNSLPEPVELMYIIQCEKDDDTGFWKVLDSVLDGDTFQWIGICRDAVFNAFSQYTHTEDQELNRFYFAAQLQMRKYNKKIMKKKWHFLGIGARIDLLQYYWFVDAMDTASLFYQSTLGCKITPEGIMPGRLKRPKDYFVRNFNFSDGGDWPKILWDNCTAALEFAQKADANRRYLLGGRL